MTPSWIIPDWPAPDNVGALQTTRAGGVSVGAYASLNLGDHVGDDPLAVSANRQRLRQGLGFEPFAGAVPGDPLWLNQVHGSQVLAAENVRHGVEFDAEADACVARTPGLVCAVLSADCLPLLLCAENGAVVAAAHAGWRGLVAGVIESTVAAMQVEPARLLAWLGPAIGPTAFEVGDEVRAVFRQQDPRAAEAFLAHGKGKWLCDLYLLARQRLATLGVKRVYGGDWCTFSEPRRFYSYRRDGVTGRMASLIWLSESTPGVTAAIPV